MNTLFKRVLAVAIGILTLGMSAAYSQSVKDIERESLSAFTGIKLGGDFVLDLRYGTQYQAKVSTEELLAEYIQFDVSGGVLTVSMDERKVPAEVKRLFRGKNNAATFKLIVTMPQALRTLSLEDKAVLATVSELVVSPEGLDISLKENARIASFNITADRVNVKMERKAEAVLEVTADSLAVDMSGSASLDLTQHVSKVGYTLSYNANLVSGGETESMVLNAKGTSKAILNGRAPVVSYKVTNASNVNAVNLSTEEAHVEMSGLCTLTEAATQDIYINIGAGANLIFRNEPVIHILSVKNASITPYDKRK